jgi:molybdopterin molybdotransferase
VAGWGKLLAGVEARRLLMDALPGGGREVVAVADAAARVLAAPVRSPEDLPQFSRAAMDGYALKAADTGGATVARPVILQLVGTALAGTDTSAEVPPGSALAIATGAPLPAGADAVVMVEATTRSADSVSVTTEVAPGRNIIARGEDAKRGDLLRPAGWRLGPRDLALLAALGIPSVEVTRRLRIAILSNGAELVPPTATPAPGQVREVNQLALASAAAGDGAIVTSAGIVGDDRAALAGAIARLAATHDLVLVSGGTSVGPADFTAEACRLAGARPLFHGLAIRPGKPTLAATLGPALIVGLPGVPVAALTVFEVFVRPLLRSRAGLHTNDWMVTARLEAPLASIVGREDYVRVTLARRDDELWASPLPGPASSLLSLATADGLVIVPHADALVAAGDAVSITRF